MPTYFYIEHFVHDGKCFWTINYLAADGRVIDLRPIGMLLTKMELIRMILDLYFETDQNAGGIPTKATISFLNEESAIPTKGETIRLIDEITPIKYDAET